MDYTIIFVLIAFVLIAIWARRATKPRPSDLWAIEAYAKSRNLKIVKVKTSRNPWPYWVRGNILLSNLSRIFILSAESVDGARSEIHLAFDPLDRAKNVKVLLEKQQ